MEEISVTGAKIGKISFEKIKSVLETNITALERQGEVLDVELFEQTRQTIEKAKKDGGDIKEFEPRWKRLEEIFARQFGRQGI